MTLRPSPYTAVLGEALAGLHPRLVAYFSPIPAGYVGRGEGVFATVGTPRRWLWPVLVVLRRQGVLFPVWRHEVPFTVENRPRAETTPGTGPAVDAVRTFLFAEGPSRMVDAITAEPAGSAYRLVDHLGTARRYLARLDAGVVDGSLVLRSTRMAIRLGPQHLWLPRAVSPTVTLTERFDDESDRQHVSVVLAAPVIGRLYVYEGSFRYAIERAESIEGTTTR